MNIKEAKEQIKNTMTAYFTKDEFGEYEIPVRKQRPIFLMGPPGIGKTAIMEQIASEMGVGILSYSMTHHTRQSALGLPFIKHKEYKGKEYDISEYTMSEIIASVYEMMENTGVEEGILFLDEINCVSETLSPVMLQFLQYKVFGRHKVPEGWVVVTAGNPPEYNNSVREFDIVTWDRLKRIDCQPDFEVWKEYAYNTGVHPAVISYLEIKKADFYKVESTVTGKTFVTARGWDDLSQMIWLYERNSISVNEKLVVQYLQDPRIAKDFAIYYDLFNKYRSDYQVDRILEGNASEEIRQRAKEAPFDERVSLLGLLLDSVNRDLKSVIITDLLMRNLLQSLMKYRENVKKGEPAGEFSKIVQDKRTEIEAGRESNSISEEDIKILKRELKILETDQLHISETKDAAEAFSIVKDDFDQRVLQLKASAATAGEKLSNMFRFSESAFEGSNEILILITELTSGKYSAAFISKYGCEEYFKHNKKLLFYERQKEIDEVLSELELQP